MKRIFAFLLVFCLLLSLISCGNSGTSQETMTPLSAQELNSALGYEILTLSSEMLEQNQINYVSSALLGENGDTATYAVGAVSYRKEPSDIELRMTLDKGRSDGLAGFENAAQAGGIDAPAEIFSPLVVKILDKNTYYCEFSYTYGDYPCYLSLSETNTTFKDYSALLITYVNQLYAMEEAPSFTVVIEKEREEQRKKEAEEKGETIEEESSFPEVVEENTKPESLTDTEGTVSASQGQSQAESSEPASESSASSADSTPDTQSTSSITLNYDDMTLVHIGDGYTLSPSGGDGSYTWESADTSIATVSEGGSVFAVGAGTTEVTCTSGDGLTATCVIRVKGE